MGAQCGDDSQKFSQSSRFQSRDVGDDHAPQSGITDMLEPGLEAGDVLFDLLDER